MLTPDGFAKIHTVQFFTAVGGLAPLPSQGAKTLVPGTKSLLLHADSPQTLPRVCHMALMQGNLWLEYNGMLGKTWNEWCACAAIATLSTTR